MSLDSIRMVPYGGVARIGLLVCAVLGLWLTAGCGNSADTAYGAGGRDAALVGSAASSDAPVAVGKTVVSMAIAPADVALAPGDSVQFAAIVSFHDGSSLDVAALADWSTSDPSVVMAGTGGRATAVHAGQVTVSASAGGFGSATTGLTVSDARVVSLTIVPASLSLAVGRTETLQVWATLSDGSTRDASALATWDVDPKNVVAISTGVVTAKAEGTGTVTAQYGSGTAHATVHVTAAPLTVITVSPSVASVETGAMVQLRATGGYGTGQVRDITGEVQWNTSNAAVGSVGPDGVFRAVTPGTVVVTATSEGLFATATLTVVPPKVIALAIVPSTISLAPGDEVSLRAVATLSNGSSSDVTYGVSWAVAETAFASVDSTGKIVGIASGSTTVTARYRGQVATASVAVSAAAITRIAVSPKASSIAVGSVIELQASAQQSTGALRDVTLSAQWSSSAPGIASVDQGKVTGLGAGSATISASYKGKSDSTAVTVISVASTGQAVLSLSVGAAYDFGAVPMGQTTLHTVTVTNTGTGSATLGTVTTAGLGLTAPFALFGGTCVTSMSLQPRQSCSLTISVTPYALADYNSSAWLSFGDGGSVSLSLAASASPPYVRLSAGNSHTCALFAAGGVKCWGLNGNGRLGIGDATSRGDSTDPGHEMGAPLPFVNLGATKKTVSVHAGLAHNCVLMVGGEVKCWGDNSVGQLGLGDTTTRGDSLDPGHAMGDELPAVNLGTGRTARQISVGDDHSCALLDNRQVKCWGANWVGQLGLGDTTTRGDSLDPGHAMGDELPAVNLGTGRIALQVTAGQYFTCALLDTFQIKCWGANGNAQLGLGDTVDRGDTADPGHAMADLTTVDLGVARRAKALSSRLGLHACAVVDDDSLKCWGANWCGQLGLGDITNRGDSAAAGHAMGDLLAAVDLGPQRAVASVATGACHTCAKLESGQVKCWGGNGNGQLGLGDTMNRGDGSNEMGEYLPPVPLGAGRTVAELAVGDAHACALLHDGTVKCWGINGSGTLGLGDVITRGDSADPGHEMGGALPAVDLHSSAPAWLNGKTYDCGRVPPGQSVQHALIVVNRGTAAATLGEVSTAGLGLTPPFAATGGTCVTGGSVAPAASCTVVISVSPVSAGDYGATARLTFSGGLLDAAVLSLRATSGHAFPVPAGAVVSAGLEHTCAVVGGQVKCWGNNQSGQLGLGDITFRGDSAAPGHRMGSDLPGVDLGTGQVATSVHAGYLHTCALLQSGQVKCWGLNDNGELGLGDTVARGDSTDPGHLMGDALPVVDLGPGRAAKQLATGRRQTCVILDNGDVKCWGRNHFGQLGLGDTTSRGDSLDPGHGMGSNLPVVDLGTGRTAKQLAMGDYFVCALLDTDQVKCWGRNTRGQLGLGDTSNRGDGADAEHGMGDWLPSLALGSNRYVKSLGGTGATGAHMCALLDTDQLKCWGYNNSGQLGLGDTSNRGDQPDQMGDLLQQVDLGPGRSARAATGGTNHSCALLDDASLKCWGANFAGQLGLGDTTSRGEQAGQMGAALLAVSLGTNRSARAVAANDAHTCTQLDNGDLKCWGANSDGRLGLGDTTNRGDANDQMGDFLPAVDLGP